MRIKTCERKQLHNRCLHLCDNGEEQTNRRQRGSAEHDKCLHPVFEQKVVREREKLAETNTVDRGTNERVTETSQGGNKKHIDWPCQSEAVNEGGRRRRGD